ncbi:MAG: hypothetical protein HW400_742, partial [Candidatus Levybacteria bacterium]|nr:hypothetical protein [Candidatus Levybacteria bacterium]
TKQEHGNLVASGSALLLVRNILNGDDTFPKDVSITPYSFKGTIVSGHSPINISVYDNSGNHTGLTDNGNIEANIPGSFYDTLDDAKFIYLPDEGTYSIKVEATDQGSFDLKIRKYEDSVNTATTLYDNIPLTSNTKGELTLNTLFSDSPIIHIDENGDGKFDKDINVEGFQTPTPISSQSPSSSSGQSSFPNQSNQNQVTPEITISPIAFLESNNSEKTESPVSGDAKVMGVKAFESIVNNDVKKDSKNKQTIAVIILVSGLSAISLMRFIKWKK